MFDYTPLRILMAKQGILRESTYLTKELGFHPTVASKINKNQHISGDSLDRICQHFNCQLSDIVEIKKDPTN